ncbi:internalin A [Vigna unguiculata]|uniref:Internalin A n=1 Tax=Vigna unguiculata TaxID=3917 RepID=A0A4D6LB02_VIGUN|nr:internalin A [Vigna unguiculata]
MPVLETLGGALFGAVLQVLFDKLDSHQVLGYFRQRDLDEKLLKKLKRKLMDINAVIDDAEQKQFTNSLVKEWLDEVRDIFYDAEDLLEQIDYEYSKTKLEAEFHTSSSKVLFDKLDSHQVLGYFRQRDLDEKLLKISISTSGYYMISIQELISNFKFLRVLSLFECSEVPDTIGELIHLRSLDLSFSLIGILPDSISSLSNLQVLKLNYCSNLTELPSTLYELTNLRRLELMRTTLIKVPPLLGNLKNLQVWMDMFEVGKSCEFSIHQLQEVDLHGELSVTNIENVVNCCALVADFKNKTHLAKLTLEWDLERNIEDSTKEREVLENLQPSRHLEEFSIDGYGGTQFPRWLSDNSLLNMVSLTLNHCKHCLWLPSLGLLTFLKHLTIGDLDWIESIGVDFYGNSSCAFASLEMLSFTNMKEWKEWQCMTGAFPNLQHLSLNDCPKLKGHLPEQLSHLKHVTIYMCEQLVASIPRAVEIEGVKMEASSFDMIGPLVSHTPLEHLSISSCPGMNIPVNHYYHVLPELQISHGCDSLTIFPLDLFPKLRKLELYNCRNLRTILQGHPHNHLNDLIIENCSQFESFPDEGLFAPKLLAIRIVRSEKLKSMPKRMCAHLPSLEHMLISNCAGVELSEGCLPSNLKELHILNCPKLVSSLKEALSGSHFLEVLRITIEDIESFPDEGLLPLSLTTLEIRNCPKLKKLDYRGLCHFSSLRKLIIQSCPILQSFPEEGLPESISDLTILDSPLLQQLYNKQEGEEWEKIAHIEHIWVQGGILKPPWYC